MNMNNEDVDLGLALGSISDHTQTRLNNRSGAGVNADSGVKVAFAASDPLSELVWSPHKGLSLKCANSGLADKKPLLLWNVGPSSEGLSPLQSIRSKGTGDDNAVDEGHLGKSQTMLGADDAFGDNSTLARPCRSCPTPQLDATNGPCDGKSNSIMEEAGTKDAIRMEENGMDDGEENLCCPQNVQIDIIDESSQKNGGLNTLADGTSDCKVDMGIDRLFSTKLIRKTHCNQNSDIEINATNSEIMGLDVANHSEPLATKLSGALVFSLPNLQSRKEPDDEVTLPTGEVDKNETKMSFPISATPLRKLESSAENDLCHLTAKEACSSGEMELWRENASRVGKSPTIGRICLYQEKGKEKALSDSDIYERSSNNEDDSHESVESCNSAGLVSKGIKRQCDDQELTVGSKRMKKQIQGNCGSFMNWISNMVKGLSDSNKEDPSSLALTLACSSDVNDKNHQENSMGKKTHDSANLNMGFQTIFQSLYYRNTNMHDTGVEKHNDSLEEPKKLMAADKTSIENLPRSCDRNGDNSCKQIIVSNKEVNPDIVGQPSKPRMFSADSAGTPCASVAENKASDVLVRDGAKDGVIPSDSLCKQMNNSAGITLAMSNVQEKSNPLSSLWITRLSTGTSRPEKCNDITQEANECSKDCPKVNLHSRANDVFPNDQKRSGARDDSPDSRVYASEKEIHRFTANAEASFDPKSSSRLCPILPSQKFRSLEAMACQFARRLDAFRHIIPLKRRNSLTFTPSCFFCGSSHDLRECPEVTETELQDLLVKISSCDTFDEYPFLCIRCFQLDHWAVSCPLAPSVRHWRSEQNASFIGHYTACPLQLCAGNENFSSHQGGEKGHNLAAVDRTVCSSRKPCSGYLPSHLTWNVKKPSSRRHSNSNEIQRSTASNLTNDIKASQNFSVANIFTAQDAAALSKISHAIRNLRLSRADILRWMNSDVSFSHLNGFYLRLRLGKLEAGPEETSYCVACIKEDAGEHNGCGSKKSILVDVGGIRSSVASQYVSNHDFLEDEIKAWWCRIVKSGCRIPSLDEMNSKYNDRKSLGF